jgi:hypothetical protein
MKKFILIAYILLTTVALFAQSQPQVPIPQPDIIPGVSPEVFGGLVVAVVAAFIRWIEKKIMDKKGK